MDCRTSKGLSTLCARIGIDTNIGHNHNIYVTLWNIRVILLLGNSSNPLVDVTENIQRQVVVKTFIWIAVCNQCVIIHVARNTYKWMELQINLLKLVCFDS